MSLTLPFLLIVQVFSALAIIILVLLQQGKGADMGSAFGSGSAGSLFGASGAANFLSRTTKWAAVIFFASTAGLAYISHKSASPTSVDSGVMRNFQPRDASVPQASDTAPASSGSFPVTPSSTVPTQPDASIPQPPTRPASPETATN
jgi:preprotein translocase subunit SecG